MSVFPVNRVPDILKRMDLNSSQAEAMKTCFGILAIMSREDSNKLLIAKDGMEIILNAMTVHVDRTDVQESGCDLLWSLAFNSSAVKDIIAKYGGSVVLVRALKRHSRSADFLKSACGALSNMCQSKLNQEGVSSQGGLQPLVGSIHVHQTNAKLLPFIFDAIASIIVNNEDNARTVSSLGIVPVVVASLSRHKAGMEVVKSGCHTLAILSDVKGQASKIAFAGGVPIILSLLDTHPLYSDLHRVAAVVLLRMLQESAHVGREITCHEGVRILLNSLEKGGAQQDTVAAVTHILYTVTNPSNPSASSIEAQLWLPAPPNGPSTTTTTTSSNNAVVTNHNEHSSPNTKRKNSLHSVSSDTSNPSNHHNNLTSLLIANSSSAAVAAGLLGPGSGVGPQGCTALTGVVLILGQYAARRDVVRAACRLINNLSGYTNVVTALDRLGILDKIFECASIHRDTKDVLDSATSLIKTIHRRAIPTLQNPSAGGINGLLHVFKTKMADEECAAACMEAMTRLVENTCKSVSNSADKRRELDEQRVVEGKLWEHAGLVIILSLLQNVIDGDSNDAGKNTSSSAASVSSTLTAGNNNNKASNIWSKHSTKVISSALCFIEALYHAHKLHTDAVLFKDTWDALHGLLRVTSTKSADLTRRVERLIGIVDASKQEKSPFTALQNRKSLISLKPPLPNSGEGESFTFNGVTMRKMSGNDDTNNNNNTLHSRDNSSGNNSLAANLNSNSGAGGGGPSPLAMGRKVKEYTGSEASLYQTAEGESLDENKNNNNNNTNNKRNFGKSKSWGTSLNSADDDGSLTNTSSGGSNNTEVVTTTSTSPKKTLPMHPCKLYQQQSSSSQLSAAQSLAQRRLPAFSSNISSSGGGGNGSGRFTNSSSPAPSAVPRLLDNWPNFLERLSVSSSGSMNRAYLNTNQDSSTPSRMQLSYESSSAAGKGLLSKCATPVPYFVPPNGLGDPFEHSLTFDSDFESGNLLRAVQKGESNYDLFLRSDLHTPGHTQWFYFAVANTHSPELVKLHEQGVEVPPVRVRFNIVNFTKPDSLFNLGMRPVVYSVSDAQNKNIGWVRSGSDISYYGNSFLRNNSAGEGLLYYYTLSFTIEFTNINDTVLIAYSYPYTMSDYRSHITEILDKPGSSDVIRQFRLCQTISGEDCDLLVVTNFQDSREKIGPVNLQMLDGNFDNNNFSNTGNNSSNASSSVVSTKGSRLSKRNSTGSSSNNNNSGFKPALFLSCRVHPGETPASWMMKGMLEFLTSDCPQAQLLRQVFVIFIVPMLNPDGVIYGNNRCNLSGVDLNRQWKLPIKALHPTIFHLKYFMQAQRRLREVCMYIDLHGHSRKYNVFMYGCDDKKKPRPQVRTFPKMLSMHSAGRKYVCYNDCSFAVKKGRESTARVVVSKEINILNSFTLEATFCGSNYGPLKHCHMNIGHLQEVGSSLCDSILNYFISEGVVKDTVTVPHNVKAVLAFEKIIASEGLGSTNDYSTSYSNSGAGGFTSTMYNNNLANGTNSTNGNNASSIAEGRERSESNTTEPSSSSKMNSGEIGRSGEKSGAGDGSDKSGSTSSGLTQSRRLAAAAAAAADAALSGNNNNGSGNNGSMIGNGGGDGIADNESDNSPTANAASSDPSPRSSTARRSPVPSTSSREIGNDCNNGENGNGDDGNVDSELDNNNENEEFGSGSDGSDADGSDTESLAPSTMYNTNSLNNNNSSSGGLYANSQNSLSANSNLNNLTNSSTVGKTRMETLSAEGGRMRMNSLPLNMHHASNTNLLSLSSSPHNSSGSSSYNNASSNNVLAITTPGLSRVLAASGRNSILSSNSNVEKINTINSMRALTTPNVRNPNTTNGTNNTIGGTLVHSYAGSLTGRGAHMNSTLNATVNINTEGDNDFHSVSSGLSGVNDGIASLQLAGIGAGAGAGAGVSSDNETLFCKTKKGKKKKQSGGNTASSASAKDKKSAASSSGSRPSKKMIKDSISLSQTMNSSIITSSGAGAGAGGSSSVHENDGYEIYDTTNSGLNFGSTSQSANNKASAGGGAGNTIVKADYQDILLQPIDVASGNNSGNEESGNALAKAQAVATPFGLPKLK